MVPLAALGAVATGLGGQALAPALGIAGQYAAEALSPSARAARQQLKKDTEALRQGKLGFSEAEKRTMLAGTQRALQAQTAGVEANLRRQAAAAGGFGRSGAQTNALRSIAATQGEQLAQQGARIEDLSQQQARAKFTDIMGRLDTRRKEAMKSGAILGGAAASAVQEGVSAYQPIKTAMLTSAVTDALESLNTAKKGGTAEAIAAAQKSYEDALRKLKAGG